MGEEVSDYVERARSRVPSFDYTQKGPQFWEQPEITQYYAALPNDKYNQHLTNSIANRMGRSGNLLIMGGAVGRLGRNIAAIYQDINVTEVDNSSAMVQLANQFSLNQGLEGRFNSLKADVFYSGMGDKSFDHVAAGGVIRYFKLQKQLQLISEMKRISKGSVTIAEGSLKDMMYDLKKRLGNSDKILENEMEMINMSLYFNLLEMYNQDKTFKKLVNDGKRDKTELGFLIDLAGKSKKIMYELVID